jgi:multiple sugar transport system permease protein
VRGRLARAGWALLALAICAQALLPLGWLVALSLETPAALGRGRFLPSAPTLASYRTVLATPLFTTALRNSLGIALLATALSVALAALAAYALARLRFPGRRLVLGAALAVALFPAVALLGPLFDLWRRLGLYDTWAGLVLPYLSFTLPLSTFVLTAFFRELPWDLEAAARLDGATRAQAFRLVILPLAAPAVATAALLAFFFAWNDFAFGLALTSTGRARPVPAALASFTGASQFEHPAAAIAAAAVVVTVPALLLVALFQRRIVAGLTGGAVKG